MTRLRAVAVPEHFRCSTELARGTRCPRPLHCPRGRVGSCRSAVEIIEVSVRLVGWL